MREFDTDIASRDVGSYNLSIATSLAFDTLFGVNTPTEPDKEPTPPPITTVDTLWINFRTLFRNLIGALSDSAKDFAHEEELAYTLLNEIKTIIAATDSITNGVVKVVLYACSYKALSRVFPHALHREVKTNSQKWAYQLEEHTLIWFKKIVQGDVDFREYDLDINALINIDTEVNISLENIFMLTHAPVDLLSRYNFNNVKLIESHTGAIKLHYQWHTKLIGLRDVTTMPFNRMTLQVFGDNAYFRPMPIKLRRFLLDLSVKSKWTPTTTKDLILRDIEEEHDPVLEAFIEKLY